MEFESTVRIDAPPASVWARISDVQGVKDLVPWIDSVELPDGVVAKGARIVVTVRAMGRRETAEAVVVEADPERHLALEAEIPQARARAAVDWKIVADGAGSRVTQRVSLNFRSVMARMAAKALLGDTLSAETAAKGLDVLKTAVEAEYAGGSGDGPRQDS